MSHLYHLSNLNGLHLFFVPVWAVPRYIILFYVKLTLMIQLKTVNLLSLLTAVHINILKNQTLCYIYSFI